MCACPRLIVLVQDHQLQVKRRISSVLITDSSNDFNDIEDMHDISLQNSFIESSDQVHVAYPNYGSNYEIVHAPRISEGLLDKCDSKQRCAIIRIEGFIIREIAKKVKLSEPEQECMVRNYCACRRRAVLTNEIECVNSAHSVLFS